MTALLLRTRTLSDIGDLDRRLYTSPHAPTAITGIPLTGLIDVAVNSRSSTNGPARSYISNLVT